MTKHSTSNIKLHEERMKQKYGVNLSTRKDVVNKTLFRSLKRFHTEKFLSMFELGKKETAESYLEKVSQFCSEVFGEKLSELDSWGISLRAIEKFIAVMVSPNHIKNALDDESDATLYKDYYSCLYQYSHKKLANMLQNRVCGFLFHHFVLDGHISNFISNCSTMSQHPEVYRKASLSFVVKPYNRVASDDNMLLSHFE